METVKAVWWRVPFCRDISGKTQVLRPLARKGEANQAAPVTRHEIDGLWRRHLGGNR